MALSLSLQFKDNNSKNVSWTIPNADINATPSNVKDLMDAVINAGGDVYMNPVVDIVKAEFVDRNVTSIELP